ncbi:matrixin family metalloprotease [Bradyrhizobium japonicum]|uniref:matrixin family metalloprotease n=1 Tax=Bradyrhizobium japonicum TaxID=375 RepID=UPI0034E3AF96
MAVALHEFGHCLGLAHTKVEDGSIVMFTPLKAGDPRRSLKTDDLNGIRAIYGAP